MIVTEYDIPYRPLDSILLYTVIPLWETSLEDTQNVVSQGGGEIYCSLIIIIQLISQKGGLRMIVFKQL